MTGIVTPASSQNAMSVFQINSIGGSLVKATGGCLTGNAVVKNAGSAEAIIQFYDGTSPSGKLIATIGFGSPGPQPIPNYSFSSLYILAAGSTAGLAEFAFC